MCRYAYVPGFDTTPLPLFFQIVTGEKLLVTDPLPSLAWCQQNPIKCAMNLTQTVDQMSHHSPPSLPPAGSSPLVDVPARDALSKLLQQQSYPPPWLHHAPLPRPLLHLHCSPNPQEDCLREGDWCKGTHENDGAASVDALGKSRLKTFKV